MTERVAVELECGYSPQDQTIAILSFLAPLNQHWPRPRPLLENQPWEEHCSETLLRSSPFYRHLLITNYYTYTHIKICIHLPTPDPSPPSLCTASLTSGSVTSAKIGCRTGWLLAGAGLPPCCKSCVYGVLIMCFCCWGVFPVLILYSPRSIVWGLFFFSSPSSCYAVFFFNSLSSCPVYPLVILYVCCVCMDRLMANFAGTCD